MRIKNCIILIIASLSVAVSAIIDATCVQSCKCEATSHTYLAVRPLFQLQSPEFFSGFRCHRTHLKEDGIHGALQVALMGSRSVESDDLARYFFPNCNTSLTVKNTLSNQLVPNNLFAENFNILTKTAFDSRICIAPQQSVFGVGFHYRQSFMRCEDKGRGFWGAISFPIQRIKNNMHLQETIIDDGGGVTDNPLILEFRTPQANMIQALNQPAFKFGKISPCALTKTGVADIQLQLGYEWLDYEPCHLESYIGLLVPTGNTPNGVYLFQPIVGHGHHVGLMFGNAGGINIWNDSDCDFGLRMEWAAHSQYLFKHRQVRSFDLLNKPWSRYLEVYESQAQALEAATLESAFLTSYGINVFTKPVDVTPGFSTNMTTAFIFDYCLCSAEFGYNMYARRGECVSLACNWEETIVLKAASGEGDANPVNDITGNKILEDVNSGTYPFVAPAFYNDNVVRLKDLDLNSAAQPSIISHTFYAAATYNYELCHYPVFGNIGGSYEFSNSNNAVVSRWIVWAKGGISF